MDFSKRRAAKDLEEIAESLSTGRVSSILCFAITDHGTAIVAVLEPGDRKALIDSVNDEMSQILGSPHHLVETAKLERFCAKHNITALDLLRFRRAESVDDDQ
jgi:hypothetical protein